MQVALGLPSGEHHSSRIPCKGTENASFLLSFLSSVLLNTEAQQPVISGEHYMEALLGFVLRENHTERLLTTQERDGPAAPVGMGTCPAHRATPSGLS